MENQTQEFLNKNCQFLREEDILEINKNDSGPVSNVIRKLVPHCFGTVLFKDSAAHDYLLFYVNNEIELTGLICRLSFSHPLRNDVTYAFACLANKYFPFHTRLLRVFNNYQIQTITLAEKLGYITYGDENKDTYTSYIDSNYLYIPLCNKPQAIKQIFNQSLPTSYNMRLNYIYLMYNCRNDLTKIGRSISPLKREKTLQGEDPELNIVAIWEKDKIYEKMLQDKFVSKRKRGEWFDLDVSDFITIKNYMDNLVS